jgi:Flp pilus assembly protein TadG
MPAAWEGWSEVQNPKTLQCNRVERGQALVELVLIAPILIIITCGVLQLALVCQAKLLVHMAVRQAAEIYLQGGSQQAIQQEVDHFLGQYPFMADGTVNVHLDTSPLMARVTVECQVPTVPFIWQAERQPAVKASMSLGRELFSLNRLPASSLLDLFKKVLKGEV